MQTNRPAKIPRCATKIAKEILDIETLETRNSDGLDFHEVSVWEIRDALVVSGDAPTEPELHPHRHRHAPHGFQRELGTNHAYHAVNEADRPSEWKSGRKWQTHRVG
jgi:hypothetical protein